MNDNHLGEFFLYTIAAYCNEMNELLRHDCVRSICIHIENHNFYSGMSRCVRVPERVYQWLYGRGTHSAHLTLTFNRKMYCCRLITKIIRITKDMLELIL